MNTTTKSIIEEFEEALKLLPDKGTFEEIKAITFFQSMILSLNLAEFLANQIVDRTLTIVVLITTLH